MYFFAISGVTAILFSASLFSEIEAKFIKNFKKDYSKIIAIKIKTNITAIVPHKTNLVKLFQVFLWFSLSIKLLLSCFKFWVCFINYVNSASSSYKFRV